MRQYFRKLSAEKVEKMAELREQGMSYPAIGKKFGIHYSSVMYQLKKKQIFIYNKENYRSAAPTKAFQEKFKRDKVVTYNEILKKQIDKDESKMTLLEKLKYQLKRKKVVSQIREYNLLKHRE